MSGGILGMFSPQGQGSGLLGNFNQGVTDGGDSMIGLGLGLMSGNMENAANGYMAGQRQDTLRRQQKLLQDQEMQKRTAAQAMVQKYNIPPELATDPDSVFAMAKTIEMQKRTPKEPRAPQIFGSAEGGYYTFADGKASPIVPGAGPKPAAPPSGYRWAEGGALEAIPGGPGDKPTDGQSNAALYAQRMQEADAILSDPKVSEASQSRMEAARSGVPVYGNSLVSKEYQKADQAQRNFINATLRRESGAVISPDEFENAKKQYFPQPGDHPDVLKQKADNRKTAIQGISNAAGPALKATQGGASWTDVGGGVKIRRKQ